MVFYEAKSWKTMRASISWISQLCQAISLVYLMTPLKLTAREKEVLQLIFNELTTGQIAAELGITVSTVETHRRNLFRKAGVRSAIGLVKEALKRGF